MKTISDLMRIPQWVKNLFIFVPAFFAEKATDWQVEINLLLCFVAFSLMTSCVYIINDYLDIESDRQHPTKSKRPLAAGTVSKQQAIFICIFLFFSSITLAFFSKQNLLFILFFYLIMNILYSFKLKHIALLDITIISIGFLLRIFAGGVVAAVPISKWLILMVFLLAMLLALAKRRDEFLISQEGKDIRKAIKGYNLEFINIAMVFMASITVVSYIMYTVSEEVTSRIANENVYLTSFFVILGILRYLQITIVYQQSGSPTKVLFTDIFIQLVLVGWIMMFGFLLYF
ncbi:MAG: prenyltransferase [Cytophagales bacterium]|nr:MAG: prenyltransferase [Cytophagales bacterium]